MPRLAKKLVKQVSDAESVSGGFDLLRSGKYLATLKAVDSKESNSGKAGWNWEFGDLTNLEGDKQPGRQWLWTMLPGVPEPKSDDEDAHRKWETTERLSAGRLKSIFEAFGYDVESETDEMLGEKCILQIGIQTMKAGPRKGEDQNYIVKVLPLTEEDEFSEIADAADGDEDDDSF